MHVPTAAGASNAAHPTAAADAPPLAPMPGGDEQDGDSGEDDLDLMYDPVLKCYYDPKTNKYYELKHC